MSPPAPPEALYLHVPFCRSRCRYCAFLSGTWDGSAADRYVDALAREVSTLPDADRDPRAVTTVFIGGGTPTVLAPRQLERLLAIATGNLASPPGEFTVEANPESLDGARLAILAAAGVTRISLGVQAAREADLRFLGRPHDVATAERAAGTVLAAGMALSLDLIYGLPGQARREWERTLRWAVGLGAGHVSAYALTIEEGTALAAAVAAGESRPPTEARLTALHQTARETLGAAGFTQYEVSNFALPGRECLHNLAYWRYRPYLGLGPGAHSRLRDGETVVARANPPLPAYLAALAPPAPRDPGARTSLSPDEVLEEVLLMGLRTAEGIDPSAHPSLSHVLGELRRSDFWADLVGRSLARHGEGLALTPDGMWLADAVAAGAASAGGPAA